MRINILIYPTSMYLVIIRLLYSLCCIVIADRRGAQRQGEQGEQNIYILCGEVARAGGGRASRGQKIAIDFSLFSGILSAAEKAKL